MKIQKMYQSALPENSVLNTESNSSLNTYSCQYLNNMNTYSTNEVFTGEYWVDGKKIYKRVLYYTITSSSGSMDLNPYYVDTLIDKRHAFIREAQGNTDFDNYYNNENDYCRIFWREETKSLEYRISRNDGSFRIIIKYTKTTD